MRIPDVCEITGCEGHPIVGAGDPPIWVCQRHLEEYLARTMDLTRRILHAISNGSNGGQA